MTKDEALKLALEALKQIDGAELVAVCSRNEDTARQLIALSGSDMVGGAKAEARYYAFDNYLEMLRQENLDAVYISLPPFLHGDLEIACSEHVKGVFIEKPVALNLETAAKMADAFQRAKSIVSVGYMNRYRANVQSAKTYFKHDPAVLYNGTW